MLLTFESVDKINGQSSPAAVYSVAQSGSNKLTGL